MLRRLLAVAAATVTIAVTTHAGMLWLALWTVTVAAVTIKPTSKVQSNEGRLGRLVANQGTVNQAQTAATGAVNTRVGNLSGQATTTASPPGVPTGGVNGSGGGSLEVGPADNGGVTSGQIGSGTSHYHAMFHQHVYDHTHDFDGHTHDLPTV